ncbi:hemolysin family protein [Embleya sp. NPDC050154]|uniref:hemolysin family protein n=1 Tax=Embleya sp. NPDC050154 TaxID=3363988 RepID=UPI00379C1EE9
MAKAVAGPQRAFTAVFSPLINHLNSTANRAVHRLGMEPAEELASARSPQELVALARHSAKAGTLDSDTADLFARAVTLGELSTEQIMTPRVRVHGLRVSATAADVVNLTRATGHSRFPIFTDSLDDVQGVIHLKHALAVPEAERLHRTVAELGPRPVLVPDTLPVDELLDLSSGEETMAIVADEHGGTAGVVTLEDIVEEVVGAVRDEHDPYERPEIVADGHDDEGNPRWDVDGGYRLDQLHELGLDAPDGPYETVAGLVTDQLSRIPAPGNAVMVDGWTLTVTEVTRHRAERVRLIEPPKVDDTEDENA